MAICIFIHENFMYKIQCSNPFLAFYDSFLWLLNVFFFYSKGNQCKSTNITTQMEICIFIIKTLSIQLVRYQASKIDLEKCSIQPHQSKIKIYTLNINYSTLKYHPSSQKFLLQSFQFLFLSSSGISKSKQQNNRNYKNETTVLLILGYQDIEPKRRGHYRVEKS